MLIYSTQYKEVVEKLRSGGWDDDVIQKYLKYVQSKQRVINTGRTAYNDSGRSKTYKAEWKFQRQFSSSIKKFKDEKEAQAYLKRVLASKLWKDMTGGHKVYLEVVTFGGATAGRAWGCTIELCKKTGMDQYTLLHELAHCAGHMHHDVSFRQCVLKLTSRFIGVEAAKCLKACFKEQKLKMNVQRSFKAPYEWLESYQRLACARKKLPC